MRESIEDLLKSPPRSEPRSSPSTDYFIDGVLSRDEVERIAWSSTIRSSTHQGARRGRYSRRAAWGGATVVHTPREPEADEGSLELSRTNSGAWGGGHARLRRKPQGASCPRHALAGGHPPQFCEDESAIRTDIESNRSPQTWAEHCKHTLFARAWTSSTTAYSGLHPRATCACGAKKRDDFCVSVFEDNSGGIDSTTSTWSPTSRTHNSPRALDPSARITGIVG